MVYRTDVTNAQGDYAVTLPHGTYRVGFTDLSGDYQSEFYDDVAALENASEVVLASAAETANASLGLGGWISGTVTAVDGGAPIEGVEVALYRFFDAGDDSYWEEVKFASTDAQGEYLLYAPAGTYHVGFNGSGVNFASEYYVDAATVDGGTDVEISQAGVGTNSIDAALDSRGRLRGTVTAAGGGGPLAGIEVATYRNVGTTWTRPGSRRT